MDQEGGAARSRNSKEMKVSSKQSTITESFGRSVTVAGDVKEKVLVLEKRSLEQKKGRSSEVEKVVEMERRNTDRHKVHKIFTVSKSKITRGTYCSPKRSKNKGTKGEVAGVGSRQFKPGTRDLREIFRGMEKELKGPESLVNKILQTKEGSKGSIKSNIPGGQLVDERGIKSQILKSSSMDIPSQRGDN